MAPAVFDREILPATSLEDPPMIETANDAEHLPADSNVLGRLVRPSMYWRPGYLTTSAWTEHLPFAFWLVDVLRPKTFVELGTYAGVSYFGFCQAVQALGLPTRCFAVDTWRGDEHGGFYSEAVYQKVLAHNEAQYSHFSRLVRSTFDDALSHFSDGSVDLLHIDGLHTYDAVRHDFDTWRSKVADGGVILFHDTNVRERGFGVYRIMEELRAEFASFEFAHGHGLGVVCTTKPSSPLVDALCLASKDPHATSAVREAFGRLGAACADAQKLADQTQRVNALEKHLASARNEASMLRAAVEHAKVSAL